MSKAKLEALGGERYRVSGVLDAATAPALLEQSAERFSATPGTQIHVDLGGVSEGDSAGLALLLEWLRVAKQRQQGIHFVNLPAQVAALARISEVEELLLPEAPNQTEDRKEVASG